MLKVVVVGYGHLGRWHLEKALSFKDAKDLKNIVTVVSDKESLKVEQVEKEQDKHVNLQICFEWPA